MNTPNLSLYRLVLIAHSDWRWVVLLAGLTTVGIALAGLGGERPWASSGAKVARFFGIALDVQVLMGFSMYLLFSPLTTVALSVTTARMPAFFTSYHPGIMFVAFISVHVAAVITRRARSDAGHHRRALIFYGIVWLMLMAGVPWTLRPWFRL